MSPSGDGACTIVVESIVEEEGGVTSGGGLTVIIGKFSCIKVVDPVVLLIVDEHLQVDFDNKIDLFCLFVCFWVVGGGELWTNSQMFIQSSHKCRMELCPLV